MKLADLSPEFLKIVDEYSFRTDVARADADGVWFLCPKCESHMVTCWSPSVDQSWDPKPGRWELVGAGIDDLSLVAGSSSVALTHGCRAHFFVRNGGIIMCE